MILDKSEMTEEDVKLQFITPAISAHREGEAFYTRRAVGVIHVNDGIMAGAMTKNRIQSDILEWHVPEEVLAVLLKDRSTGDFMFPNVHTLCKPLSWSHYRTLYHKFDNFPN